MKRVQFPPIHCFVHKYGRRDDMWKRSTYKWPQIIYQVPQWNRTRNGHYKLTYYKQNRKLKKLKIRENRIQSYWLQYVTNNTVRMLTLSNSFWALLAPEKAGYWPSFFFVDVMAAIMVYKTLKHRPCKCTKKGSLWGFDFLHVWKLSFVRINLHCYRQREWKQSVVESPLTSTSPDNSHFFFSRRTNNLYTLVSLSNDDGDGNENDKQATGLD